MESKETTNIGRILRLLRIANDLSARELAAKAELSQGFISEVEAGKKKPSLDALDKYSKALGVSKATIMYFEESEQNERSENQELLYKILQKLLKVN